MHLGGRQRTAVYDQRALGQLEAGAHALQFGDVGEAIGVDAIAHHRDARDRR